jgi:hypothetical protein
MLLLKNGICKCNKTLYTKNRVIVNKVNWVDTNYIRPCIMVETIVLNRDEHQGISKAVFVYNYENYHYRLFQSVLDLANFLNDHNCCEIVEEFENEDQLVNFLSSYNFST